MKKEPLEKKSGQITADMTEGERLALIPDDSFSLAVRT